ncbi:DUF4148 domain-containing protein [Ramlibacter sp. AN1133]|uniref:DUF4148 domain-containing protein n=1 Tax=Ramlibacter sp. AN1133 TaxID=3133429 RepID=UPI0030C1B9C7
MNRKIALTFVLASLAAASAFAETPMVDTKPFKGAMTREQVRSELQQHRKTGVDVYADGYNQLTDFRSTRTRAEVKAEFLASRDMVSALNSEDSGSHYLARREMPRTVGRQLASLPGAAE